MFAQADPPETHDLSGSIRPDRAAAPACPDFLDAVAKAKWAELCELGRCFAGGRGAGKTHGGASDLLRRAKNGRTYMIASPTSQMMADTTFPKVRKIAEDIGVWRRRCLRK